MKGLIIALISALPDVAFSGSAAALISAMPIEKFIVDAGPAFADFIDSVEGSGDGLGAKLINQIKTNVKIQTTFFAGPLPWIVGDPITVLETQNNISCDGGLDGGFSLNILGGITDYTVNTAGLSQTLSGGATIFSTLNNLSAGTYNYTITDSNNCIYRHCYYHPHNTAN